MIRWKCYKCGKETAEGVKGPKSKPRFYLCDVCKQQELTEILNSEKEEGEI